MPGFDPWTFGSKAQSLTSVATAAARIGLPKLRVVSFPFVLISVSPVFSPKSLPLYMEPIVPLITAS